MLPSLLATLLFACSAVSAHRSVSFFGFQRANLIRLGIAAVCMAAWAHGFGVGLRGPGLLVFVISGLIGFGFGDLAMFAALPRLGSRLTALMTQCLAAPMAAVTEWLWLGAAPRASELLCGAAILAGVGLALMPHRRQPARPHPARWRMGMLFGLLAAAGQGGGAVVSRKAFALDAAAHLSIDGGTAAYQRLLGGLLVATLAYTFFQRRPRGVKNAPLRWRAAWPWTLANTLCGPVVGVSCYQWALAEAPSALVMSIVSATPLAVIPLTYLIEGERPSRRSLAGGAIAVAGAATLAWLR